MYSAVLVVTLATASASPTWHRHGCYSCSTCHSCYGGGCHGCYGSYGYASHGYGWAGGCYGYHGGCYGAFGVVGAETYYHGGCYSSCYGCYGGHSCYGVPLPGTIIISPARTVTEKKTTQIYTAPAEPNVIEINKRNEVPPATNGNGTVVARAKVRLEIPEGGKLFVDGKQVAVAPGARVFQTPALAPGETYYYDIRIEAADNRREERRVVLRAGEEIAVNFESLRPAGTLTAQGPR